METRLSTVANFGDLIILPYMCEADLCPDSTSAGPPEAIGGSPGETVFAVETWQPIHTKIYSLL
jgi:hypothetical protein